jgi:chromosome segregation ATPase
MGGKGKKKKKKGPKEEPEPDDELMKLDGATLERTMATLRERLNEAKSQRNLIQIEKDMIQDFYTNTRKEIKEGHAQVGNLDTQMQKEEEQHRVEIKVYLQKVKHLEYDQGNKCEQVSVNATTLMKEERENHTGNKQENIKSKDHMKKDYDIVEKGHIGDIDEKTQEHDEKIQRLREMLNGNREQLIESYEDKYQKLKEELELRLKVEIHEIEERKNQHINELMTNHEVAFTEMKNYYNDITRENLDLIRMHKERLADFRAKIDSNQKSIDTLKERMEELKVPLSEARKDRDTLKKKLQTFDKNKMALTNAKARLEILKKQVSETRENRIELDKKFEKVEKEKQDMYVKYELAIEQLRQKSDYKNTVLDERLEVLANELDRKDGQL